MHAALVAIAVSVVACAPPPCEARAGIYSFEAVQRPGGSCPPVINGTRSSTDVSTTLKCRPPPSVSADNCTVTTDTDCFDASINMTAQGVVHWNQRGTLGVGVVSYVFTGAVDCQGVYDVTYSRL